MFNLIIRHDSTKNLAMIGPSAEMPRETWLAVRDILLSHDDEHKEVAAGIQMLWPRAIAALIQVDRVRLLYRFQFSPQGEAISKLQQAKNERRLGQAEQAYCG
jgi:hypothetical protein